MTERRRFHLHMGMGKTGSSALQIAFLRNTEALARADVVYPSSQKARESAHEDLVRSGNGGGLRTLLVDESGNQDDAWDDLRERMGQIPHNVLFSSEVLFMARQENLERLVALLDEIGRDLLPILYFRNIAGHAVSSYGQRIKRSGATDSLLDYCENKYQPNYRSTLEKLMNVVPASSISVVHYDTVKDDIFGHFMSDILEIEPGTAEIEDPVHRSINRSLTHGELTTLRTMNRALKLGNGPRALSDALIKDFPDVPSRASIPEEANRVLRERFADEVAWVNQQFFDDARLSVISSELSVTEEQGEKEDLNPRRRLLLGLIAAAAGGPGHRTKQPRASRTPSIDGSTR